MIPIRPFKRENALRYGAYYVSRLLPYPCSARVSAPPSAAASTYNRVP